MLSNWGFGWFVSLVRAALVILSADNLTLMDNLHTKTLSVRVRDKQRSLLNQIARLVNFVWNYVNELSHRSIKERVKAIHAKIANRRKDALDQFSRQLAK
ncbi:hypothetical protein [Marinospirillum sp.]|uniref:hypothetical protein n=1 Tax=Marinospirillum sp. TaxID=2183934 RepID=UPI0025C2752C|nr:hypothetical protein [Marinospirillum sp.]